MDGSSRFAVKRKLARFLRQGSFAETHVVRPNDPKESYMDKIQDVVHRSNEALNVASHIFRCWLIRRCNSEAEIPELSKFLLILCFTFNFNS